MQSIAVVLGILGALSVVGAAVGVFLMSIRGGKTSEMQKTINAMATSNGELRDEVRHNKENAKAEMASMELRCATDLHARDERIARLEGTVETLKSDLVRDVALEAARTAVREVSGAG